MKKLKNHLIGVEQGDSILFSDYQDGGEMWTGEGPRERRRQVTFSEPFGAAPSVQVSLSMVDVAHQSNHRVDVSSEKVTIRGFDIVFRTWGDTRVARARVAWMAIGQLRHDDDWELY